MNYEIIIASDIIKVILAREPGRWRGIPKEIASLTQPCGKPHGIRPLFRLRSGKMKKLRNFILPLA